MVGGGRFYTKIAAATVGVKSGPGRVFKIIVVAGTGTVSVYDNAAGDGSGNVLWTKTTVAVGDIYNVDIPAMVGISAQAAAATTVNVTWS
jgi:hypothetical protein